LIPLTILNAITEKPLPVYGQGVNIRDWLHVEDHVAALRKIVDRGRIGETYLVGARNEARNIDLVHSICRLLDSTSYTRSAGCSIASARAAHRMPG
jgi:dTDP-glucose 4,6-dehydratase